VVDKIATFPCFPRSFKRTFRNKWIIKFQGRLKEGDSWFLEFKKKHNLKKKKKDL